VRNRQDGSPIDGAGSPTTAWSKKELTNVLRHAGHGTPTMVALPTPALAPYHLEHVGHAEKQRGEQVDLRRHRRRERGCSTPTRCTRPHTRPTSWPGRDWKAPGRSVRVGDPAGGFSGCTSSIQVRPMSPVVVLNIEAINPANWTYMVCDCDDHGAGRRISALPTRAWRLVDGLQPGRLLPRFGPRSDRRLVHPHPPRRCQHSLFQPRLTDDFAKIP